MLLCLSVYKLLAEQAAKVRAPGCSIHIQDVAHNSGVTPLVAVQLS
jgi:hypothetical protein